MPVIHLSEFMGLAPRYAADKLPPQAAQVAENCRFAAGNLEPINSNGYVATPSKAGVKQTIWRYLDTYWFHWLEDVDILPSPLAADPYKRVYWTGEGTAPRMAGNDIVTGGGGTDYPTNYYTLGVPAPDAGTEITIPNPPTPSDSSNIISTAYVYTYVTGYGEEGPPSLPSNLIDISPGDAVDITIPGTGPTGAYNVTEKRIYRLNSGVYQLLATLPAATTTYQDTTLPENLGSEIDTVDFDPPHASMKGIVALPHGVMAGFFDNVICFCEPYLPHAWPVKYRGQVFGDIVGLAAFGSSVVAITREGPPCVFTGTDPGSMMQEYLEYGYAGTGKRGIVDMGPMAVYPSAAGLVGVGVGMGGLLTEKIMTVREWRKFAPESINAYRHGSEYVGFYDNGTEKGGFVFDIKTGAFSTLDYHATAGFTDQATGDLYLMVGDDIVRFDDPGEKPKVLTWRSRQFIAPMPLNFGAAQVIADEYPVTVRFTADNRPVYAKAVESGLPFRLPGGFRGRRWEVEVVGDEAISEIKAASTIKELRQG